MNKKGGAIVEAAMVFPVMILTIVAVLCMLVYFWGQIHMRTAIHMDLRAESGRICDNFNYVNYESKLEFYQSVQGIYSYNTVQLKKQGILKERKKDIQARKYLIDEVQLVWVTDLMKKKEHSNEE